MDITLTEDQRLLRDTVSDFARDRADPARARAQETTATAFDPELWRQMAELGLAGAPLPERLGGSGTGILELGLIVEALGANALATPIFSSVVEAALLMCDCASEDQQAAWLPRIAAGDALMTVAWLETRRDLCPHAVETRLSETGDGGILTGRKFHVRDANAADAIVCLARKESGELVLALVDRDAAGVTLARMQASGSESVWHVGLDAVPVAGDAIVAGNSVARAVDRLALRGAALKACELAGIGQAALDLTVSYASQRRQFGVPIGSFQAVHHHCAEMLRDISVTRLLARQACALLDVDADAERECSMAKAKASEAIPAVTRMAQQIHGAVAFYRDYPLELYYHRAIAAQAAYGDALHHRKVLADMLASDPHRFRGDGQHEP